MNLNVQKFYQATNPLKTLDIKNPEDAQKYIDFSEVRGGQVIEDLKVELLGQRRGRLLVICLQDIWVVANQRSYCASNKNLNMSNFMSFILNLLTTWI